MASNQWVAIENEDAGDDNEPEHYWYYFQANGKALTNGENSKVALKTINGKKYAFDDEGKMLYGWVDEDTAERVDNTDGDGFIEGDYYFGGEDDGAMTVGWLQMDITYDNATNDYEIAPVFNDDEDQTRWFYFKSNGKKVKAAGNDDKQKSKTINGKKYEFDENGAMTAEWSLDVDSITAASKAEAAGNGTEYTDGNLGTHSTPDRNAVSAQYAKEWRYFNSVEDGARVSRGWFKVVAAEYLNYNKYNDDEDAWYYADGSGNLYAGEFKTIKGKKYAFQNDGRMVSGLKFIKDDLNGGLEVVGDDNDAHPFDDEERFDDNSLYFVANGYDCYYFGGGDDGAMRTNKTSVEIDGDNYNFYFEKSGGHKGAGKTGEKDDKYYQAGKLVRAGSDEKYQVVQYVDNTNDPSVTEADDKIKGYVKMDEVIDVRDAVRAKGYNLETDADKAIAALDINKKAEDLQEVVAFVANDGTVGLDKNEFFLVNTSGKMIDSKSKNKDGNDYNFVVAKGGSILGYYVED